MDLIGQQYKIIQVIPRNEIIFQVNVFVEGHGKTTVVPGEAKGHCRFDEKIYTVNVKENSRKRTRLTKVTSNCEREHKLYRYSIAQDGG